MSILEKDWLLFVTVAEEKNMTKAANKLFITQPALSYKINQIEKNFNIPLFIRTTKGMLLTEAGEMYYHYVKNMIEMTENFQNELANKKSTIAGTLRIGSAAIFANFELPSLLSNFTKLYPEVKLQLQTGMSAAITHSFVNNNVHVAIIRGTHNPPGESILLYDDPICLVTAKDCRKSNMVNRSMVRYTTDQSLYSIMDAWWKENFDVPLKQDIWVDTMATCREFVKNNLGWSILPYTGLENLHDEVNIEPLYWASGEPILRSTALYYTPEALQRRAVKAFVDYMKEYAERRKAHGLTLV